MKNQTCFFAFLRGNVHLIVIWMFLSSIGVSEFDGSHAGHVLAMQKIHILRIMKRKPHFYPAESR